jgi:hypothetical protein
MTPVLEEGRSRATSGRRRSAGEPGWYGPYQGKDSIPDATGGGVFDIDRVLAGEISLSDGIVGAIEEHLCEDYPPEG